MRPTQGCHALHVQGLALGTLLTCTDHINADRKAADQFASLTGFAELAHHLACFVEILPQLGNGFCADRCKYHSMASALAWHLLVSLQNLHATPATCER